MRPKLCCVMFLTLFIISCSAPTDAPKITPEQVSNESVEEPLCTPPYFEWKKGECCLDANDNKICDCDESEEVEGDVLKRIEQSKISKTEQDTITKAIKNVVRIGGGSGLYVSEDGHILTNWHVVEPIIQYSPLNTGVRSKEYGPLTADGFTVLGANEDYDIALLKTSKKPNGFFEFADSDKISVGDAVIALGYPINLNMSVSKGVISGKGRSGLENQSIKDYLQTDAAINKGNSGGPLLNQEGQVVGLNTFGYSKWSTEGLYFALESNRLKQFFETLSQIKTSQPTYVCERRQSDELCFYVTALEPEKIDEAEEVVIKDIEFEIVPNNELGQFRVIGFSIDAKNNNDLDKQLCFKLTVIDDAITLFDEEIESRLDLKPNINIVEEISVPRINTKGDAYFEVQAYTCGNPDTIFRSGYTRRVKLPN